MTGKQSLVSIIVPIYNVEKYLAHCIDSILAQTYQNIEIILIDDGSTDESGKIADSYAKKHKNILVIHKQNGGLSSARNAGLEAMHGEWVAFIDSDDYVEKDFVKKLLSAAKNDGADIATCTFLPYTDDGSPLKKIPTWPQKTLSGHDAINDMMRNKRPAYVCLNLFRASLFKEHGITFPSGKKFEDIAPKVALLYYANKVTYTNEPLYHYLIRRDSITGAKTTKKTYDDFLEAITDVRSFLEAKEDHEKFIYIDYFELYSSFTLLNFLARERRLDSELTACWKRTIRRIRRLLSTAKYPTLKNRFRYLAASLAATNRRFYSALYRRSRK